MGEVYRARDAALGRDVAIKVMPPVFADDADRLRRFKQEAQAAAALTHPNILTIYHVGEQERSPFIVSELLEGESLRQRLQGGALPVRKAVDYAAQVARGLAAAHDKGIVHRDLKPENIFICRDGRVKILDFGLAKLTRPEEKTFGPDAPTMTVQSEPGFVLGTVGYMSPEQVRGQAAGPASDLFSFGAILYEMLSGKRAFRGETSADTMSSILKEEPQELSATVPPALERIVRRCLEKNPEERFQSARDVAFDLEALSSSSGSAAVAPISAEFSKSRLLPGIAVALAILAAFAAGALTAMRRGSSPDPTYQRITFRAGTIQGARFAPDGQSLVYSGSFGGDAPEIFTTRPQSPESRSLRLAGSALLAVSSTGEMAISMGVHPIGCCVLQGIVARVPLEGGAPREIQADVQGADWSKDGSALVIARQAGVRNRLEFPPGKLIYESGGVIAHPRLSRQGDRIAFFEYPSYGGDAGSVELVDMAGKLTTLSTGWTDLTGLAWSPKGDEVWFSGDRSNSAASIFAVSLSGKERSVTKSPGDLLLFDISQDGRVLMAREDWRSEIYGLAPAENKERDLSWFDYSVASGLSADGKTMIFFEGGEGAGAQNPSFLRTTEGSPAVRLYDGGPCWGLSHDSHRVFCTTRENQLMEVPTKTGQEQILTKDHLIHGPAEWLPEDKRIAFSGQEPGHGVRVYIQEVGGSQPRAITPEGTYFIAPVSPDGRRVAAAVGLMGLNFKTLIFPVDSGDPQPVPGLAPGEVPIAWSQDGLYLYCYQVTELPVTVFRVEVATGKRMPWKKLEPSDPVGISSMGNIFLSADAKSYVYTVTRKLDALYVLDNLH
jgi:Tol biopolymer transport system component